MSGGLVVNEDNSREVSAGMLAAYARALEKVGLAAEGYAKSLCPVDTGRLRNSITHQVSAEELAAVIGTNVEYGPYVELGTSAHKAQPFLTPAAQNHGSEYRAILESELKNG